MILEHLPDVRTAASRSQANHLQLLIIIAIVAGIIMSGFMAAAQSSPNSPPTTSAPSLSFEVASLNTNNSGDNGRSIMFGPGRFTASGATIRFLITMAYMVKEFQVSGGPSWVDSEGTTLMRKKRIRSPRNWKNFPKTSVCRKKAC
jgi:hypothetical protein